MILGVLSITLNINSTANTLEQTMKEMSAMVSERVEQELLAHLNVAEETGLVARLSSDISIAQKQEIINQRVQLHGYQRGDIIGLDGISIFSGNNYNDREYFQHAIKGKVFISNPLISKTTGELTVIVAAPLWERGVPNSQVVEVVYFVPVETFLNDIMANLRVSQNSYAYMLNNEGTIIAHQDIEKIKNAVNIIENSKTDKSLTKLASFEQQMINGEKGFGVYDANNTSMLMAFSPISNTNGWSVAITAPVPDFMKFTNISIFITKIGSKAHCFGYGI